VLVVPIAKLMSMRGELPRYGKLGRTRGLSACDLKNPAETGTEDAMRKAFFGANGVLRRAYREGGL
jgi:hypothetical protein